MYRLFFRFVFVPSLLLFAASALAQDRLVIEGTGDSQQVLRQLAEGFEAANPGTDIVVPDSIGSSGGVKALLNGKTDIARVARSLKDKERAAAADLVYHGFAYSPVVFAANLPEKCVDNLSTEQVVGIFSGKITDWSALGNCKSHKIYIVQREAGDSSRSVIEKEVAGFKSIPQLAGKTVYSTPEARMTVEEYSYTIGFLPQGSTSSKIQIFSFNGVAPKESKVLDGSYPLASPLGLVWRGELSDLGSRFVKFLSSSEGLRILRDMGVVPVTGNKK